MKLVASFEEACAIMGYDPATVLPDVTNCPKHLQEYIIATAKLAIIQEASVGDWVADYNDFNQRKWYPWFYLEKTEDNPSGFRFDDSDYVYGYSFVGSRRSWPTREMSDSAGTQFADLYRIVIHPKP